MSDKWTADRIPDQSGRVAVVTGANSGLGLITARELARAGATGRARLPQHRQGRRRAARAHGRGARGPGRARRPRPRQPGLDPILRPGVHEGARRPRPADQQRRRDGAAAPHHQGWLRAPVRHQPPRPLRPHRPAARRPRGPRGCAGGHGEQHRPPDGPDQLRRSARRTPLPALEGLRPVEARQPAVRARARSASARGGLDDQEPRRPPRLRRDQPPVRRGPRARSGGDGGDEPADRAGRGGRGAVAALRRDRAGARGWNLRGAGRAGRATRPSAAGGGADPRRPRRGRRRATVGRFGGGDRRPLRPGPLSPLG